MKEQENRKPFFFIETPSALLETVQYLRCAGIVLIFNNVADFNYSRVVLLFLMGFYTIVLIQESRN